MQSSFRLYSAFLVAVAAGTFLANYAIGQTPQHGNGHKHAYNAKQQYSKGWQSKYYNASPRHWNPGYRSNGYHRHYGWQGRYPNSSHNKTSNWKYKNNKYFANNRDWNKPGTSWHYKKLNQRRGHHQNFSGMRQKGFEYRKGKSAGKQNRR